MSNIEQKESPPEEPTVNTTVATAAMDLEVDAEAANPDEKVNNLSNDEESSTVTPEAEADLQKVTDQLYPVSPLNTTGEGVKVTGGMDLATLESLYGPSHGISGYKVLTAKPRLIMPVQLPVLTWFRICDDPEVSVAESLKQGTELLARDVKASNALGAVFAYQGAEWQIHLGKILLKLKVLVRKSNQIWGGWAAENLKFISQRTMEKMMRLARREDCWPYSILGADRLDVLLTAIPQSKDKKNAIGAFLEKHNIPFDPTHEFELDEFKRQIDLALNDEKLRKNAITLPAAKIANLVDNNCAIDGTLIKEFQAIQRSGGDLGAYADYLITTGGRGTSEADRKKKLQDVNSLASRLTRSIDEILSKQDLIEMIDRDIYRKLLEKLNEVSMLRDMATDYKDAAAQV